MLSRFNRIPERDRQTDGQTDRQTELLYRASVCTVLTRDKNAMLSFKFIITFELSDIWIAFYVRYIQKYRKAVRFFGAPCSLVVGELGVLLQVCTS